MSTLLLLVLLGALTGAQAGGAKEFGQRMQPQAGAKEFGQKMQPQAGAKEFGQ